MWCGPTKLSSLTAGILLGLACLSTTGCSSDSTPASSVSHQTQSPGYDEVLNLTTVHEKQVDDGWYFNQYPRIFKTQYAGASPDLKARFAVDYAEMLKTAHQDLVANWDSYVSYTARTEFANKWWHEHDDTGRFAKLDSNRKLHVVWLHESILDASELWWRSFEIKNAEGLPTEQALAHDEEQKKVFNYMDHEGQPRSLSDLVVQDGPSKVH